MNIKHRVVAQERFHRLGCRVLSTSHFRWVSMVRHALQHDGVRRAGGGGGGGGGGQCMAHAGHAQPAQQVCDVTVRGVASRRERFDGRGWREGRRG